MNTTDLVHFPSADVTRPPTAPRPALAPSRYELSGPVRCGIVRARDYLVGQQRLDGSWAGQRTGDILSLCRFALLQAYLGSERDELVECAARAVARGQRLDGGWSVAPGSPMEQDTSVLAYFTLKLAGEDGSSSTMRRARQAIRERGGADRCGAEVRLWLALLGQVDYDACPPAPPERLLFSIGDAARTTADWRRLAAISVVWALRPQRDIEVTRGIRELFVEHPEHWPRLTAYRNLPPSTKLAGCWTHCEQIGFVPLRRRALDKADRLLAEASSDAGADDSSVEELAWRWIALAALGHTDDSHAIAACANQIERLIVVDTETDEARAQPETSLTADTALAIEALAASGVPADEPHVSAGIRWVANHRASHINTASNWRELAAMLRVAACLLPTDNPASAGLPPHLRVADRRRLPPIASAGEFPPRRLESISDEMLAALCRGQRADGGWSTAHIASTNGRAQGIVRTTGCRRAPVSDPDVTGATLELLARCAGATAQSARTRAVAYLRASQRGDGSWATAAGDQLLRATTGAIRGLIAAGAAQDDPAVAAGVNWLLVHQLESGGWGEVGGSTAIGRESFAAEATAIQTAWAVLALVAAGLADHDTTRRAVALLVDHQGGDGAWVDDQLTERDSAAGGWYRNDLATSAWPLVALAHWTVATSELCPDDRPVAFRLVCDE